MMFDRSVIINLDRRSDRWVRVTTNFRRRWPFAMPVRVRGCDGQSQRASIPKRWRYTVGAWGCLQSHLAVCDAAVRDGCGSLAIFEDDALLVDGFAGRLQEFMAAVPDDWDALYLGGNHYLGSGWPVPVNHQVLRGRCVLGAWAYVLRGRGLHAIRTAIEQNPHCLAEQRFGVDRLFGAMHAANQLIAYTPWQWLVCHGGGRSNINGMMHKTNYFGLPEEVLHELRQQVPEEVAA